MSRGARRSAALLVLIFLAAAAGCGPGSEDDYLNRANVYFEQNRFQKGTHRRFFAAAAPVQISTVTPAGRQATSAQTTHTAAED